MPGKMTSKRALGAALFILAVATFAPALGYDYVWDDMFLVDRVRDAVRSGGVADLFTGSFYVKSVSTALYYRPVMFASLLADIILTNGAPWFSHLINILIHALNSTLVFLLLRKTLREDSGALAGALLFTVYPVHAGTVAAVYNRMELMTLALILPLAIHWAGYEEQHGPRRDRLMLVAVGLFLLACFTKETAFLLPVVLAGWEVLRLRPVSGDRLKGLGLAAAAAGTALLVRGIVFTLEAARTAEPGARAGTLLPDVSAAKVFKIILINMRLAVYPFKGRTHWAATDLTLGWETYAAAAGFLLIMVWGFRRSPLSTARGLIWWAAFTLPVAGLFNVGPVVATERYAYIPSVGMCLVVGGLIASLRGSIPLRRLAAGAAVLAVVLMALVTARHTGVWRNEITLFEEVTRTNPSFPVAHVNLGVARAREGDHDGALSSYARAWELVPGWTDVAFNRGNLYFGMGRYEEALGDFDAVLETEPGDWEALLNRANTLAALDRPGEAEKSYLSAMEANGSSGKPLVGLGVLAARDGDFRRATALFSEAAEREPGLSEAYEGLGEAYAVMGMNGLAEGAFLKALEKAPENSRAAAKLGWLLVGTGRPVQAERAFTAALSVDPSSADAWVGLLRSLEAAGEKRRAEMLAGEMELRDPVLAGRVRDLLRKGSPAAHGR